MIKRQTRRHHNKHNNSLLHKQSNKQMIDFKNGWQKIEKVGVSPYLSRIENVVNNNNDIKLNTVSVPKQEFIETYDTIFTMCIQREPDNHSSSLYNKYIETITKHYKQNFIATLSKKENHINDITFLTEWVKRWKSNQWIIAGMSKMFQYLDRFHTKNNEDLLDLTSAGYRLFHQIIFDLYKNEVIQSILNCIQHERNGTNINDIDNMTDLLRDCVDIFVELQSKLKTDEIYKNEFHKIFITKTKQYYKQQSAIKLAELSCPEYLKYAEKCIQNEINRQALYLHSYSQEELMKTVRNELLMVHQKELLNKAKSGINSILERAMNDDIEDIHRLYSLYSVIPGGNKLIIELMGEFICELGFGFIAKSKENKNADSNGLISSMIDLHDKFSNIINKQCGRAAVYHKCLKDSFELFINKELYLSAFLARYCNDLLSKGTKMVSNNNMNDIMENIVMIYGYIRDKDIFENKYQQYLANRLLQDLSANSEAESAMIGKLKNEAGYYWTNKLEGMFKDLQHSQDLIAEYNNSSISDDNKIDLNITICTTGSWPTSWSRSNYAVVKPAEINKIGDSFTSFYLNKFNGRKLTFRMDKGRAECFVRFNKATKKILVVSTYQMIVLLCFNDKSKKFWTFQDIQQATNIPSDSLKSAILSMVHPRIKVLRKSPNTKTIENNHKIQINPNYKNQRQRIIIPTLRFKLPNIDELNELDKCVVLSRRHQTDAAIVRVLKARQTLGHNELIGEVHKQLIIRFTPKPIDIKKRINALIELEYMERDQNDRETYKYLQ